MEKKSHFCSVLYFLCVICHLTYFFEKRYAPKNESVEFELGCGVSESLHHLGVKYDNHYIYPDWNLVVVTNPTTGHYLCSAFANGTKIIIDIHVSTPTNWSFVAVYIIVILQLGHWPFLTGHLLQFILVRPSRNKNGKKRQKSAIFCKFWDFCGSGYLIYFLKGLWPEFWNPYPYPRIFPLKIVELTVFENFHKLGPISKGFSNSKTNRHTKKQTNKQTNQNKKKTVMLQVFFFFAIFVTWDPVLKISFYKNGTHVLLGLLVKK